MPEKQEFHHKRAKLEDVIPLKAPYTLLIDPCGACNFKCNFCPCNHSDIDVNERHKIMSWELFKKIVEDLKPFEGQIKVITLAGFGEPLLNPFFPDMIRVLKENRCCREIRTVTNASLLDEKMSRAIIDAGIDLVRVSVEALSAEGYQELCGVHMEFSEILHNVETFYRLSRGTKSKITAKIVSESLSNDTDVKRFYDLFGPISDAHYIENIETIWPEFGEMKLPQREPLQVKSICYELDAKKTVCTYPFTDMYIRSNGLVTPCCADWKFDLAYGDVKKESLTDIWNSQKIRNLQCALLAGDLKEYPFCQACSRKPADPIEDPQFLLAKLMAQASV